MIHWNGSGNAWKGEQIVRGALSWLGRTVGSLLTALLLVGLGFYLHFLWAGPELKPWHRMRLEAEFTASDYADGRVTTLAQYREREQRLLDQVRTDITPQLGDADRLPFNRFNPGSLSDPNVWAFNWNRTFVLQPEGDANGGVLLLHGLTDSPYSLRSIGLALAARGYRVVGLRLPGDETGDCFKFTNTLADICLLYTSPSPRD